MRFAGANLTVNPDDFVRKLVNRYTGDFFKTRNFDGITRRNLWVSI